MRPSIFPSLYRRGTYLLPISPSFINPVEKKKCFWQSQEKIFATIWILEKIRRRFFDDTFVNCPLGKGVMLNARKITCMQNTFKCLKLTIKVFCNSTLVSDSNYFQIHKLPKLRFLELRKIWGKFVKMDKNKKLTEIK